MRVWRRRLDRCSGASQARASQARDCPCARRSRSDGCDPRPRSSRVTPGCGRPSAVRRSARSGRSASSRRRHAGAAWHARAGLARRADPDRSASPRRTSRSRRRDDPSRAPAACRGDTVPRVIRTGRSGARAGAAGGPASERRHERRSVARDADQGSGTGCSGSQSAKRCRGARERRPRRWRRSRARGLVGARHRAGSAACTTIAGCGWDIRGVVDRGAKGYRASTSRATAASCATAACGATAGLPCSRRLPCNRKLPCSQSLRRSQRSLCNRDSSAGRASHADADPSYADADRGRPRASAAGRRSVAEPGVPATRECRAAAG